MTSNLPAALQGLAPALANSAATAGQAAGGDMYLKMDKHGDWSYGAEGIEPEEGALIAINPAAFEHGWTAWGSKERGNEGTNVGELLVPATSPMPARDSLPDVDGDWDTCIAIHLRIMDGEDEGTQLVFKSNSRGGREAYQKILSQIVAKIEAGDPEVVPLIELGNSHYIHSKYGKTYKPELVVKKWMRFDALPGSDEAPAAEETTDEAVAAAHEGDEGPTTIDGEATEVPDEEEQPTRRRRRRRAA